LDFHVFIIIALSILCFILLMILAVIAIRTCRAQNVDKLINHEFDKLNDDGEDFIDETETWEYKCFPLFKFGMTTVDLVDLLDSVSDILFAIRLYQFNNMGLFSFYCISIGLGLAVYIVKLIASVWNLKDQKNGAPLFTSIPIFGAFAFLFVSREQWTSVNNFRLVFQAPSLIVEDIPQLIISILFLYYDTSDRTIFAISSCTGSAFAIFCTAFFVTKYYYRTCLTDEYTIVHRKR